MESRFERFTVLIAEIGRSIRRIKTEEMVKFDLKSTHVSCLYYLYRRESLTAKELCDMCEEDKASISRSLEYLETNGYIVCGMAAQKRYRAPLSLTEKGEMVGRGIAERIDSILIKASEGLSEEKRTAMYESLALIQTNLQNICDGYTKE